MVGVKAHNPKLDSMPTRTGRSPLVNAPRLLQVQCIVLMHHWIRFRLCKANKCNNLNQIIYINKLQSVLHRRITKVLTNAKSHTYYIQSFQQFCCSVHLSNLATDGDGASLRSQRAAHPSLVIEPNQFSSSGLPGLADAVIPGTARVKVCTAHSQCTAGAHSRTMREQMLLNIRSVQGTSLHPKYRPGTRVGKPVLF